MHLLDTYALACGSKVEKPYLYTHYFPMPIERYITFQAQSKFDSKDYSYWQDVVDIISPILSKNNIHVLQVGNKNERVYKKVIDLRGQTNVHQLGYVMEKSLLHVGPDSFGVHLASMYNVPIVGLYSVIQSSVAGPRFGDKNKHILFDSFKRTKNGKPSYAASEYPKSINSVKPEEVAQAIFKLLNIEINIDFQTVYTGAKYGADILRELIPNSLSAINNPERPVEIRCDLFYDQNILNSQLGYLKKAVVVTDKLLDVNMLKFYKKNIVLIAYKVTEHDNPEFVRTLINEGFNIILLSKLTGDDLNNKKINYYDLGKINPIGFSDNKVIDDLKKDIDNLYYRSCKLIASKDKIFASHAAEQSNIPLSQDAEYQKVIDSSNFWEDLDFYTLVKKVN